MPEETHITQEEVDALLGELRPGKEAFISEKEEEKLGEVYKSTMISATEALSQVLNKQVKIENPDVKTLSPNELESELPKNAIVVETEHVEGLKGMTYMIFLKEHGASLADLAIGGDGTLTPENLTEVYLGALGDALAKMIDAANSFLSTKMGKTVFSSQPPMIRVVDFEKEKTSLDILKEDQLVRINYNLQVGDLFEGNLIQLIPTDIARPIVETIEEKEIPSVIPVQPVQFAQAPVGIPEIPPNMELLMDVPVEISVELGRTNRNLGELLKIGAGYIMELDKLVGEPVDILVNGRLIAKGGVVVVDENFGVRITSIVNPKERIVGI
ncbi:TPA: flagellar motor switch protein FliN [bacterium]|nr:flagellar motor switch protein FliN [bacterium]